MAGYARIFGNAGGEGPSAWFGDGSDGDLSVSGTLSLPATIDTGHIFKQYKNLIIPAGAILQPANRCAGMVLAVQGDCTIAGTASMDKKAPRRNTTTENAILNTGASSKWLKLISTIIGGKGGDGGLYAGFIGYSGVGGDGHRFGGGYGGGGHGVDMLSGSSNVGYRGGASEPRPLSTLTWPYPGANAKAAGQYGAGAGATGVKGGAAPGGGGGFYYQSMSGSYPGYDGDAYGGGLLVIIVGGILRLVGSGLLTANGGDGAGGAYYNVKGGGGGGGIIVLLTAAPAVLSGDILVNGGTGGYAGAVGTIEHLHLDNDGIVTPWDQAA